MAFHLPVELWQEIISYALIIRILPRQGATLFEDLDVFGNPCKINHYLVSDKTSFRLVCRLWNEIVLLEGDRNYCPFTEAGTQDIFDLDTVKYAHRLEFIEYCESYCRRWPCRLTHEKTGRCPPVYHRTIHKNTAAGQMLVRGDWPMEVQVVRFLRDIRDPTNLLQRSKNLKALSMRFANFSPLDQTTVIPTIQNHLSHLHLHNVYDDGTIHTLNLPYLRYLDLYLNLRRSYHRPGVFPLEIHMPNVVTIYLRGLASDDYSYSVDRLIMSSKQTLVNLLLTYNEKYYRQAFPFKNLAQFPRFSTLGFGILNLRGLHPERFCNQPLPNTPTLTLLLLNIESHSRKPQWRHRRTCFITCIQLCKLWGRWFSEISIPLEWSELEDLWAQACETYQGKDGSCEGEHDPLPCYWSILDRINEYEIPIRDRNGVGLWEGEGAKLARRMKAFAESDRYASPRLGEEL
ncbi:hypothetical protein FRC15_008655 [Serendipita sp. 397]|nr:hypothetical protein FRC15_008655 [Serendipita sp. 397]